MSYRNKGTVGPTVIVSCEPDRSGNFVCDATVEAHDVTIQRAIDYVHVLGGGLVIIKPRMSGGSVLAYDITNTITMYEYIGLMGATGGRSTELRLADNSDCDMIEYAPAVHLGGTFIYIGHLILTGNKANQASGHGIHFHANPETVMDSMFERVYVSTCKEAGFHMNGTWGIRITQCLAESNDSYGFHLHSATEMYVDGCYSASNGQAGYYIQGGAGMVMTNCRADSNGNRGFYWLEHSRGGFSNLYSYNNTSEGFYIRGCNNTSWVNCNVDGNATSNNGFRLIISGATPNTYLTLSNCIAQDAFGAGFDIQASEDVVFDGCIAHDNGVDGFNITNAATRVSILGGVSKDNGAFGIDNAGISTLIKDITFNGNATAAIRDTGTDTRLPFIWVKVTDPNDNIGTHPAVRLEDDTDTDIYDQIYIPLEFQELVTAEAIVVSAATGDMVWTLDTNWGKLCASEDYNVDTDTDGGTDTLTINDIECVDIAPGFTGIAPGDLIGVNFMRDGDDGADTIGDVVYYLGIRVRYV